jgi:hypothetical protein
MLFGYLSQNKQNHVSLGQKQNVQRTKRSQENKVGQSLLEGI